MKTWTKLSEHQRRQLSRKVDEIRRTAEQSQALKEISEFLRDSRPPQIHLDSATEIFTLSRQFEIRTFTMTANLLKTALLIGAVDPIRMSEDILTMVQHADAI